MLLSHFRLDANYVSRKPPINRRVSVWIPIERIRETPVIESVRITVNGRGDSSRETYDESALRIKSRINAGKHKRRKHTLVFT